MYYNDERRKRNIDLTRLGIKSRVKDDEEGYGLNWSQENEEELEEYEHIERIKGKESVKDDTLLQDIIKNIPKVKKYKQDRYTTYIDTNLLRMLKFIRDNGGDNISVSVNKAIKFYLENNYFSK